MTTIDAWNLASSIASIVLALLAIILSILFFVLSFLSEKKTESSLTKIETQADMLQKLSARWMDRLTKYVTTDRPTTSDAIVVQLTQMMTQLPQTLTSTLHATTAGRNNDQLIAELHSCYIALYFYTAQTNFWSQYYVPKSSDYDETNDFHTLVCRMTDMSAGDFNAMAQILSRCEQTQLDSSPLAHLLVEARDFWRERVHTSTQAMAAKEHTNAG